MPGRPTTLAIRLVSITISLHFLGWLKSLAKFPTQFSSFLKGFGVIEKLTWMQSKMGLVIFLSTPLIFVLVIIWMQNLFSIKPGIRFRNATGKPTVSRVGRNHLTNEIKSLFSWKHDIRIVL